MNPRDATLELLVRSGKEGAVERFATAEGLPDEVRVSKQAEAGVFNWVHKSRKWGNEDPFKAAEQLAQDRFKAYFSATVNTALLVDVTDVILNQLTEQGRSPCHDITGFLLFIHNPELTSAVNRNLEDVALRSKMHELAIKGFTHLFASWMRSYDDGDDPFEEYYPLLSQWKGLLTDQGIEKVVQESISSYRSDIPEIFEEGAELRYNKDFMFKALRTLREFAGDALVAEALFKEMGKLDEYEQIAQGIGLTSYQRPTPKRKPTKLDKALDDLGEATQYGYERALDKVKSQAQSVRDKQVVVDRLVGWLREGKEEPLHWIAKYQHRNHLYEERAAQEVVTQAAAELLQAEKFVELRAFFALPPELVDRNNAALAPLVRAYNLVQEEPNEDD